MISATKLLKKNTPSRTIDYEKLVSSDDEKKLFELTKSAITSYLAVNAEVSRLIDQGKMDEAYPLNRTESRSTFGVLQESIKKLIEYNHKGANADGQKADRAICLCNKNDNSYPGSCHGNRNFNGILRCSGNQQTTSGYRRKG